ncbi:uncharacterized protein LOC133527650 [Cydia pomonella]|uniref:uncharacterized protein LOC133527650 n=1 Tax=Cydia pomonella TaxID=82600 RepID=UPI002ADDBAA7|nr:uncharacterized protein LOC133527650 [Cydia pomonella]
MPLSIFIVILMLYLPQFSRAVDTDGMYGRMPPWTAVDEYEPCMRTRGDAYCFTSAKLKGSPSDPLYKYLVEYSADNLTHYDRTNIHRGICVKQTCSDFQKISPNLTIALEACLNANTIKEYGLIANVFKVFCEEYKEHIQFDASDFAFGAVLMALLVLNLSGSLYDYCGGREDTIVGKIFLFFAVKRNWQLLVAPPNADPTQSRLESLNGSRQVLIQTTP